MRQTSIISARQFEVFKLFINEELQMTNLQSALQLMFCIMSDIGPGGLLAEAKEIFTRGIVMAWFGIRDCNELIVVPFVGSGSADEFWDNFDNSYEELFHLAEPFAAIWKQIHEYLDNLLNKRLLLRLEINKFDILLGWRLSQLVAHYSRSIFDYINEVGKILIEFFRILDNCFVPS